LPRVGSNCTIPKGQVPYGTTKSTYKLGLSPDAKLDRNALKLETQAFPRNPTDQVSQNPPVVKRAFQGIFDQMVQKPKYDKNVVTTKPWEPKQLTGFKTANNRSSECLNIITG